VSVAVFAKMNAAAGGCYCNIDVHDLYAQAQRERVPLDDWPSWITKQIQSNSRRIRTWGCCESYDERDVRTV